MNESIYESFEAEEITAVRRKPSEVTALREKIYLVVTDQPEQHIQEFNVDSRGRLLHGISGELSDWSFESVSRIGNWDRPSGIASGRDEEVALEDDQASKFFTYDFGKALVRHVELLNESREASESDPDNVEEEGVTEPDPVDFTDIDDLAEALGLSPAEKAFFS